MPMEQKYTDEKILEALRKCLEDPKIHSSLIAEELGATQEYIKNRLKKIMNEENSPIEGELIGNAWCFKLK